MTIRNLTCVAVANRGDAAVRFIRAARAYERQHGSRLDVVALYTRADEGAPFVRMASHAVCIGDAMVPGPDGHKQSAYLDIPNVVSSALACGADALWPGWGFASERPELPEACEAAGMAFLGPPAGAMRALGDKITAKRLAESCDVPVSPWSGGPVDEETARDCAARIGYPVLLKAAAGGGGRGIRRLYGPEDVVSSFRSAAAEAAAAFGDPAIFVEALVPQARHIEVQILADQHGGIWAVGTRDCSMQRRQQKLLEEAPAPNLPPELERALCDAAVRLARACGYVSAGTAEFLLLPDNSKFYFLEMNTRLQVEHTVTEEVFGIDLVCAQIDIARGLKLPSDDPPPPRGAAIEARLNAEDPDQGFAPRGGKLMRFTAPLGPGLRVDAGYVEGGTVPSAFDPMIAKIIAHGQTRAQALARLQTGLLDTVVVLEAGLTNRAMLLELLGTDAFRDGVVTTGWLDRYVGERPAYAARPHLAAAMAAAAVVDYLQIRQGQVANLITEAQRGLPRTVPEQASIMLQYQLDGRELQVEVATLGPQEKLIRCGGWEALIRNEPVDDWQLYLELDGRRYAVQCCATPTDVQIEVDGVAHRFRRVSDGRVRAPLPAAVAQLHVQPGDTVAAGDRLVTLEAMKMETTITSSLSGIVRTVLVRPSALVAAGEVMLELDVSTTTPRARADVQPLLPPHQVTLDPLRVIEARLLGFDTTAQEADQALAALERDPSVSHDRLLRLLRAAVVQEQLFKSGPYDDGGNDMRESSVDQLAWFVHHRRMDEQRLSPRMIRRLRRFLNLHGINDDADPRIGYSLMRLFQARKAEGESNRLLLELLHALARLPAPDNAPGPLEQRAVFENLASEALQRGDRQVATAAWSLIYRWHDALAQESGAMAAIAQAQALWAKLPAPHAEAKGLVAALCALPLDVLVSTLPLDVLVSTLPAGDAGGDRRLAIMLERIYGAHPQQERPSLLGRLPCRAIDVPARGWVVGVLAARPDDVAPALAALPSETEADLFLGGVPTDAALAAAQGTRARWTALWAEGSTMRSATFEPRGATMAEQPVLRDLHPADPIARELARYEHFTLRREPAPKGVILLRAEAERDERLLAFAGVDIFDPVQDGDALRVPAFERIVLDAAQAMRDAMRAASGNPPAMNRIALFIRPAVRFGLPQWQVLANRLASASQDLGLETVSLIGRFTAVDGGTAHERMIDWRDVMGGGRRIDFAARRDLPVPIRSLYEQKVLTARKRGLFHPYELVSWLLQLPGAEGGKRPYFEELDLDTPRGDRLVPVGDRPWGTNPAGIVVGLITNVSRRFPEGFTRLLLIGDATKEMGSLGEAECRRLVAAIDLAEDRRLPVEWVALSAGARIAFDSGTENLDWTAAVLRRIVTFTAAGGVINVVVDGPCVGAQSYWNAEATMLMHCRGTLVMTPRGYMVLTGKRALEISGSVAASTNEGIGGLEIMLANGEAQYAAADLHGAYDVLLRHYEYTYVAPDETGARRLPTSDPTTRDVSTHPYAGPGGFTMVGELFDEAANPGRKKPFAIREVIRAVSDQDVPLLERWAGLEGGETAVTMHGQLGGHPVCFIGIESQPIARRGERPLDGPASWMSGTLFPHSSRKIARAIRGASGLSPVVLLANLSGFDGSPESIRERQLEYGAEIGKAVVEFEGPILFCVVARYHGGAYVVFSRRLTGGLESLALQGSYASVIGGGAAAAVVFPRLVSERVNAHPRVRAARTTLAASTERRLAQEHFEAELADVQAEVQSAFAREFDAVHSVSRALQVGSLHAVLPASELRPALCARLDGLTAARTGRSAASHVLSAQRREPMTEERHR